MSKSDLETHIRTAWYEDNGKAEIFEAGFLHCLEKLEKLLTYPLTTEENGIAKAVEYLKEYAGVKDE